MMLIITETNEIEYDVTDEVESAFEESPIDDLTLLSMLASSPWEMMQEHA